jgi:hypothetical protein
MMNLYRAGSLFSGFFSGLRTAPRLGLIIATLMLSLFAQLNNVSAAEVDVNSARLESSEDGYRLAANFSFELGRGLEDAITRGTPLVFNTEVELTRPRWYWFDEKAIHATQSVRIGYDTLTNQYTAAINGGYKLYFAHLDDALELVQRPRRWLVAEKGALTAGATYNVAVRLKLDVNQLSKPFQLNVFNSDWRLTSDWKRFSFKADEK